MPTPKSILFVHSSDELYGADIILYNLLKGLDRTRFAPVVVVPTDVAYAGQLSALLQEIDVPTYRIKMGVLRRMYFRSWRIILFVIYTLMGMWSIHRIVRRHQIALVHSNTSAVINGAITVRLYRLPHIWHLHEILTKPKWFAHNLNRYILNNADKIVCVSHGVAKHFQATTQPTEKIQVLWNGIDTEKFAPQIDGSTWREQWTTNTPDSILFGIIGRISEMKGQHIFLEAAYHVIQEYPNAQFFIIGSPIPQSMHLLENLKIRATELNLTNKVNFIPFVSNIPEIMQGLDVIVVPSTQPDPLPTVVLEGMASARPVIASAQGGALEMIVPDETGILVEPNDPEALAKAMLRLAENAELRKRMGNDGRARVEIHFSIARFNQEFNELYGAILP